MTQKEEFLWEAIPNLTDDELLLLMMEEAAEVIQAVSKIRRFGELVKNPNNPEPTNNYLDLKREFADLETLFSEFLRRRDDTVDELRLIAKNQRRRLVRRPATAEVKP
jgi:NTP pyrophosphatase (non-canonical NTP hydrolase)